MPPEIIMGLRPLVLLNNIPDNNPADMELTASCLPLKYPIYELKQLYAIATTPAEFPKKGPLRVTAFRTELSLNLGGWPDDLLKPSCRPQTPPMDSADR